MKSKDVEMTKKAKVSKVKDLTELRFYDKNIWGTFLMRNPTTGWFVSSSVNVVKSLMRLDT